MFGCAPHQFATLRCAGQYDTELLLIKLVVLLSRYEFVCCVSGEGANGCTQVEDGGFRKLRDMSAWFVHVSLYKVLSSSYFCFRKEAGYSMSPQLTGSMICDSR